MINKVNADVATDGYCPRRKKTIKEFNDIQQKDQR